MIYKKWDIQTTTAADFTVKFTHIDKLYLHWKTNEEELLKKQKRFKIKGFKTWFKH